MGEVAKGRGVGICIGLNVGKVGMIGGLGDVGEAVMPQQNDNSSKMVMTSCKRFMVYLHYEKKNWTFANSG
jgi:hypothetical protein